MNISQLLDEALAVATRQGYEVRHEHLGGNSTGYCQLGEQRWIVIDVTQPTEDQLDCVTEAIAAVDKECFDCSDELRELLGEDACDQR
ncbi:MAG: hypothetical protein ACR2NU_05535 [Aeoliella sp.]